MSKAKLIIALMYNNKDILDNTVAKLIKDFGEIDLISEEYEFNFTKYYKKEFGENLLKRFLYFKKSIKKENLPDIKIFTNKLENKFRVNEKRQINIDPGYIDNDCLVMASNKKMNFKEKVHKNIFLHRLLEFKKNEIVDFYHTFPDYKTHDNKKFFERIFCSLENEN